MKQLLGFLGILAILAALSTGETGCANIVPPSGGPRDSLPPVLVKSTPRDSSTRFEGKTINLVFDEFVQVDNFSQNVIISPLPRVLPGQTSKLNTISVRLRDTLEANTTYTINFGNSIKDINEGNVMKEFTYVFSTGPYIDSLTLSGSVILAETGQTDTTLTVMLHRNGDDSAIVKEKPRYVTKLDGKGRFVFHNLPPGRFYLYALKDESRTYLYRSARTLFAFADSVVNVRPGLDSIRLYAYQADKSLPGGFGSSAAGGKPGEKRLRYQTSVRQPAKTQDILQPFFFSFDKPLKKFDSSRVHFSTDSSFTPVTGYSWKIEGKKISLVYPWKPNTVYHLVLDKDFATDSLNQQLLRPDTISFTTLGRDDYARLTLRFRNLELKNNPVLQFVQNSEVVTAFPLTGEKFTREQFSPGEYQLRILYDANQNGKWDPGEFFGKHRQPEIVRPIERQLNIKAAIENDVEIIL